MTVVRDRRLQPNRIASRRKQRYLLVDYLFWSMMLFVNVPELFTLWGVDTMFKPYRVISLVLAVMVFGKLVNEPRVTRQFSRPLLLAVAYATMVTIIFAGRDATANAPLLVSVVALFISTYAPTSRKSLLIGMYAFVLSYLVSAYFGFIAFRSSVGFFRFTGLFENPNAFGYGGCFVLILALNRRFPLPRLVRWILALGTVPVMALTGSRGAILSAAGGVISQMWRNPRLFFGLALVGIALVFVSLFAMQRVESFVSSHGAIRRFTEADLVKHGGEGRIALAKAGLQVAAEHGFVGIGLGQYRLKHHTRFFRDYNIHGKLLHLGLHNIYVSLLTEWGLPAFCCFGLIVVRLLRATRRMQFERDFVFGFIGVSAFNGVSNDLIGQVHFWVMLGVCIRLIYFASNDQRYGPRPIKPHPLRSGMHSSVSNKFNA